MNGNPTPAGFPPAPRAYWTFVTGAQMRIMSA